MKTQPIALPLLRMRARGNYVDLNFILCKEKCLKQSQDLAPVIFKLHNAFYLLCTYDEAVHQRALVCSQLFAENEKYLTVFQYTTPSV